MDGFTIFLSLLFSISDPQIGFDGYGRNGLIYHPWGHGAVYGNPWRNWGFYGHGGIRGYGYPWGPYGGPWVYGWRG